MPRAKKADPVADYVNKLLRDPSLPNQLNSLTSTEEGRARAISALKREFSMEIHAPKGPFKITVHPTSALDELDEFNEMHKAAGYRCLRYGRKDLPWTRSKHAYSKEVYLFPYRIDPREEKLPWKNEELPELLALGAQHSHLLQNYVILADGSGRGIEVRYTPALWIEEGVRIAGTEWWQKYLTSPSLLRLVSRRETDL